MMGNFYTDVIQKDARFSSTSRVADLALLEPTTRIAVQNILAEADVPVKVWETYRSEPRQQMLFKLNATKLRTVGVHHYGLACDIVKVINGEPSWKGDFSFLGILAKRNGLIWGGDWGAPNVHHTFVDMDHVQRCTVQEQIGLFNGTWYPES